MSAQPLELYCDSCQRTVAPKRQPLDITTQLFFSVLTLGCWIPIWFFLWLSSPKICSECGQVFDSTRSRT